MSEPTPRKSLGQHWLFDEPTLKAIVKAGEVGPQDTVLEIGPGLGTLTTLLVKQAAKVIAIEKDAVLVSRLSRTSKFNNLQLISADILKFDLSRLPANYKVVANIPYYLTSNLLRRLLEDNNPPALMALLTQKEVAERITAKAGKMSLLAFSVQYYAQPTYVKTISRTLFEPAPQVDSAILQIRKRPHPAFAADTKQLFRLVKAAFAGKRKQLKNSLAAGLHLSAEDCSRLLKSAGVNPVLRAQELSLESWHKVYQAFTRNIS